MLGGGIYVTQNKKLPGSYINIVNASSATSAVGERGVVAAVIDLGALTDGVIEITSNEFHSGKVKKEYADSIELREIFRHASKVYLIDCPPEDAEDRYSLDMFEPYDFNVLCCYSDVEDTIEAHIEKVKYWRDEMGKKCQVVVFNYDGADHEGVINVMSEATDVSYSLVAWVSGAVAGCKVNESCTNMLYDGELDIMCDRTQAELEKCLTDGQFVFHNVYGEVRVLEDINSLTTFTDDKGEDFKYNQTIRVIDQVANDIAKLFNTKYLGRIPNNASGRVSLWADIVAHHRQLEAMQAIEAFDSSLLTVEQGNNKKSVVVNDAITVVNAMAQLYMTVVIQ